jgi:hypothetical protein
MIPFIENKLPVEEQLVKIFIERKDNTPTSRVGYWSTHRNGCWYYITNPPHSQSFKADNVIGWENI